jgi:hypothetical protein
MKGRGRQQHSVDHPEPGLIGGDEVAIEPGVMVRCAPAQMRQLATGDNAAKVLVIGAIPGRGYRAPAFTELPEG